MQGKNKNVAADDQSAKLNWLAVIPEAWAISVSVFLHRGFGERRQATDMYDSVLEQQDLAERFRGMRGDDC